MRILRHINSLLIISFLVFSVSEANVQDLKISNLKEKLDGVKDYVGEKFDNVKGKINDVKGKFNDVKGKIFKKDPQKH